MTTLDDRILTLEANADRFDVVVNGDSNAETTTSGSLQLKSILKFYNELQTSLENSLTQIYSPLGDVTGSVDFDVSTYLHYTGNMIGNITLSFSNLPVTNRFLSVSFFVTQDNVGGKTITFPPEVIWDGRIIPSPPTDADMQYLYNFLSFDKGVTWLGFLVGYDFG